MIPTFRPVKTTLIHPPAKPIPAITLQTGNLGVKQHFGHLPHTYSVTSVGSPQILDADYYARYQFKYLFMGAVYVRIAIVDKYESLAVPGTLSSLVNSLRDLGLNVSLAYIDTTTVDIYLWSPNALTDTLRDRIRRVIDLNRPRDVTLNSAWYIRGTNIMIWDRFFWDDGSVWAEDPVKIYP